MREEGIHQRAQLLFAQSRNKEAISLLEDHCAQAADDHVALYLLAHAYLTIGEKSKARNLSERVSELAPAAYHAHVLGIDVELIDENFEAADSLVDHMIAMYPEDADAYYKKAQIKYAQRNYDRTLEFVNKSLELDAQNVNALNLKIIVGGLLGDENTEQAIEDALHLNPESATTIASQAYQMIRNGQVDLALERLELALSKNPTNAMAREVMVEALRNRFIVYRLFFKYQEFIQKLSKKGSWTFIIGVYLIYQGVNYIADRNESLRPILMPIVYSLFAMFILTWVIEPLMNLYLLTNKYGRLLLDTDDKLMAKLTGTSFLIALGFGLGFALSGRELFLLFAILFGLLMIPLGSFLKVNRSKHRQTTIAMTVGIFVLGILGILSQYQLLITLTLLLIIGYQFVINGMAIKENARTFGD